MTTHNDSRPGTIPIGDARRIAEERRQPIVVIFGLDADGERFNVTTYGQTKKLCKLAASFGDQFAKAILDGRVAPPTTEPAAPKPIDMVLHCPACGEQHVDAPEPGTDWDNPPHRSHKCHGCGAVWRPADVPTNGVLAVGTRGGADTWPIPLPAGTGRSQS